jgi:hypothetical protein
METLKNISGHLIFCTSVIGGILIAFGNDYGFIGLIPAIIYTFTNKD